MKMKVKDIISTDIKTIPCTSTCLDVIKIMEETNKNCLFVVDEENKYLGMISVSTFLHHIIPSYLRADGGLSKVLKNHSIYDLCEKAKNDLVTTFMDKEIPILKTETTLLEILLSSAFKGSYRLPVIDNNGVLLGSINRKSIRKKIYSHLFKN
jgi:predicted transcriptional regulator